jgi:peptidoglycan/LPS O-acetylase OafA/YrhL
MTPWMSKTFGSVLKQHGDAGPGFDVLRLFLALAILASHVAAITGTRGIFPSTIDLFFHLFNGGARAVTNATAATVDYTSGIPAVPKGLSRPIVLSHVPMFFALSGFLVAGSAFRTRKVLPFLALRFFRIFPALCVEVVLSAIVIGATFTMLPLYDYYRAYQFWTYFGNIIGIVQMQLPGVVFGGVGDAHTVNANLWTLPGELHSYLILSFLMMTGFVFNRIIYSGLFAAATLALLIANLFFDYNARAGILANDINVYYFAVGVMFFIWREYIPHSLPAFVIGAISSYFLIEWAYGVYFVPIALTYVTIFLGLTNLGSNRFIKSGDYSYGIYLYGFPLCQVLVTVFVGIRHNFFGLLLPTIVCTLLFAFLSWHLVEKRFLRLRKYFSRKSAKIAEELHPDLGKADEATRTVEAPGPVEGR